MSVDADVWYVKLADGDVERVTLDELDEAFQKGQIDENSMVLAAGTDQWMKLGELLQASDATPPPPQPTPTPQPAAQSFAPRAPVAQHVPQPMAQPPAMVRQPSPMQAPVQPLMTVAPPPSPLNVPVANTLRPMSFDLEADDVQFPRARSGKGKLVAALAVAVLGAAAFVVVRRGAMSAGPEPSAPAFAAAAQPPAPPPPPETAAPAPPTPVQASMGGTSSVMDPTRMDRTPLSDSQKQKLLEADKKVKTHERSHGGGGGAVSHAAPTRAKSSPSFTTTGSKYDPLNSNF